MAPTQTDLKALRKTKGITQVRAARFCGVTPNTWARWERGEIEPSRPAKKLIAMMASPKYDPRLLDVARDLDFRPHHRRHPNVEFPDTPAQARRRASFQKSPFGKATGRLRRENPKLYQQVLSGHITLERAILASEDM
jgi:transcriptional regulator with XRE-family HTH domain